MKYYLLVVLVLSIAISYFIPKSFAEFTVKPLNKLQMNLGAGIDDYH